jgi:hypothetical protein
MPVGALREKPAGATLKKPKTQLRSFRMKRKLSFIAIAAGLLCLFFTGCVTTIDGEKFSRRSLTDQTFVAKRINDQHRDKSVALEQHALLYIGAAGGRDLRISNFDGKITMLFSGQVGLIPPGSHQMKVKPNESMFADGVEITYTFEPGKLYMLTGDSTTTTNAITGTLGMSTFEYTPWIVNADEDIAAADKRGKIVWDIRIKNIDIVMEPYRKKNP